MKTDAGGDLKRHHLSHTHAILEEEEDAKRKKGAHRPTMMDYGKNLSRIAREHEERTGEHDSVLYQRASTAGNARAFACNKDAGHLFTTEEILTEVLQQREFLGRDALLSKEEMREIVENQLQSMTKHGNTYHGDTFIVQGVGYSKVTGHDVVNDFS